MSNKPNEEEIKLADDLDIVIKSLENYFYFVYTPDSIAEVTNNGTMGLLTLQPIPVGDGKALDARLYIMGDEAPFYIHSMKLKARSDTPDGEIEVESLERIPDGVANDGTPLDLSLFNLILHIYEACDLTDAQKEVIETRFIAHFQDDIHEVQTQEVAIKRTSKGFKVPTTTLKMNAKTTRALVWDDFRQPLNGQHTMIPQSGKNGEDLGYSYVALNYMGDDVTIKRTLTDFDMAVYNAISNLYIWLRGKKGNNSAYVTFTLEDIWATMNGIRGKRVKVPAKKCKQIIQSVDKLRFTDSWINLKEEKGLEYSQDTSFTDQTYKGMLLHIDHKTDDKTTIFEVFRVPILFEYCAMKKQIITIDTALLDVTDTASNTDKIIIFRDLLITEITYMRFNPTTSRKRLLSKLYEKTTLEEPLTRDAKREDISAIRKILTSWRNRKEDLGFIEDFYFTTPGEEKKTINGEEKYYPKEAKNGQPIDGIYIILPSKYKGIEEK